tara:strand:+ start:19117 stop:20295 length:1179 start_codon:yes stop_codon:yes gene_type:complete
MLRNYNLKIRPVEMLLGLGLGLGYMTSLRFFGPIGIAELMVLIAIFLLFQLVGKSIFRYEKNTAGLIKIYMILTVYLLLPFMTLVTSLFVGLKTDPQYIISFMMGITLSFLLVEALRTKKINMGNIVLWFAYAYIFTNIITILLFPSSLESDRYTGAADNPNQLMFYASSASLLLVIYHAKLSFILVPIITWITLKSASDAYTLTLFVTVAIYLFIFLLFGKRFSFGVGLSFAIMIGLSILYFILTNYLEEIILIWQTADQGGSRSSLLIHAYEVTLSSPIFGYGAGKYSGMEGTFQYWEAHNTYLDLSMQFGMIFPAIIYFVFFAFLFNRIKYGFYLQAAFVAAFIVSGLFHFSGRHFFFWVEFAIFYYYVFYDKKTIYKNHNIAIKEHAK